MKNYRFVYVDIEGNTCIVWPMQEFVNRQKELGKNEQEIKYSIINKDILPYCPSGIYHELDYDVDIPKDRYFRNAWTHDQINGRLIIDRTKAENIHMNKLRELREDKLKRLDLEFMKALEANNISRQNEITTLKQQLRDMPEIENLSNFLTLEDLKNYIPNYLKD